MKQTQLINAAKEVAYVPGLDRLCVVTAWLGNHAIVDLGFAEQRVVVTVPVEGLVVFKRQGPDQTLIDFMARPEPTPEERPYRSGIGAQISNCADQAGR